MNKWGEIGRFNHEGKLYILSTSKIDNPHDKEFFYCPSFIFEISTKSAKKTRDKKLSKLDMKFSLISDDNNKNLTLIREVIQSVKEYLDTYKPEFIYLGYYGYGKEQEKRIKLYSYVMKHLGYNIFFHKKKERYWDDIYTYYKKYE